jgi:hypothetical protein
MKNIIHGHLHSNITEEPGYDMRNEIENVNFIEKFLNERSKLLETETIDGIILVINFEEGIFSKLNAEQFVKLFGSPTIKSLMLLAIKANSNTSENEFKAKIMQNPVFQYLRHKNNEDVQYFLWNNINLYDSQEDAFLESLNKLEPINLQQMSFIFDLFKNEHEKVFENNLNQQQEMNVSSTNNNQASITTNHAMNLNLFFAKYI